MLDAWSTFSVYPRAVEALRCGRAFRQAPLRLLEASARIINLRLRDLGMSTPLQNAKVQSPSKLAEMEAMKRSLEHLVHCCHGDERPDCPILDELGTGTHEHRQHA